MSGGVVIDRKPPLRCAAIDLGSYSAKLTIAESSPTGWHDTIERVEITGLGRGEPRRHGLHPDARRRTLEVLAEFAAAIEGAGATAVVAAGTAVLRHAPDALEFVAEVRARTGIAVEVIAGVEEARLTYLGAVSTLPPAADQLVFDIGGASTELAWGTGLSPDDRRSLDVGTIELARRFGLVDAAATSQLDAATAHVAVLLDTLPDLPAPTRLVGIGATPATLLALNRERDIADSAEVHGQSLARGVIEAQIGILSRLDAPQRRDLPGLHPDRAEVVLAGAAITAAISRRWPAAPLILSGRGLRAGLMRDRFGDGR